MMFFIICYLKQKTTIVAIQFLLLGINISCKCSNNKKQHLSKSFCYSNGHFGNDVTLYHAGILCHYVQYMYMSWNEI